jgi:GcrA cell cycle regulator
MRSKMNEQIPPMETQHALHENDTAPPTVGDAADMALAVLKPVRKKRITTIDLTIDTCRWPVGDPTDSDFHYCGTAPLIGRPYCDKHDRLSYQAARRTKAAA